MARRKRSAEVMYSLASGRFCHSTTIMSNVSRSCLYQFGTRAQQLRRFRATVPRSHPYLVWAPDHTDDGALARRMAVRPSHFVTANKHIKQGILSVSY